MGILYNIDMENDLILKEKNSDLLKEIIKILVFFDLFDYPLTSLEIINNLSASASLMEIERALNSRSDIISQAQGFYFLLGRETIVGERQQRHNYSLEKIKIARRFGRIFSFFPFVKLVAVCNSIGSFNLRSGSDIDFFIITSKKRIWLSRAFCTGLAKLLNIRPTEENKKNKICLSFYVSYEHLNLDSLRLSEQDPYFDYWIKNLFLLYNKNKTYEKFIRANQSKPNIQEQTSDKKNYFLDSLEKIFKKYQLKIMPAELLAGRNSSDGVVINDQVLKFYLRDRRREFLEKYECRLNQIS